MSLSNYKFSVKELNNETNYSYSGARYYDSDLSQWLSVDPMSDSRPNLSPYNYCQWNPVGRIDSIGMLDTKYVDETGTTLYETKDGLTNIIIISKENKKIFEDKLNKLNKENKLNDPSANKKDLHSLGMDITDYKTQYETDNPNHDAGFPVGYEKTYNGESTTGTDIFYFFLSFGLEGSEIKSGYNRGKEKGEIDKKNGRINMLDPYKSLKNNVPIIKLKPKN